LIIVTGSAGGIGSAIAAALGPDVFGIDRHNCDLRDEQSIEACLANVREPVEVLVNCAGVSLEGNDVRYWDDTFAVNVRAAWIVSRLVAREMPWGGRIINVTSINAHLGFPRNPAYVASKAALLGLTRALAVDLAPGIRVNAVCPGYVRTAMTERSYSDPHKRCERLRHIPLARWADPEDIVGAVKFLASHDSAYMTGAEIVVDGGWMVKGL